MPPMRFGIWALVHGSRAALQDPDEPYDASWERNRALVLEAERLGFHSTLVAQHTINPHHAPQDQLEAWTSSAALAAVTERIEIITAIKPYLYHPGCAGEDGLADRGHQPRPVCHQPGECLEPAGARKGRHRIRRTRRALCLWPRMDFGGGAADARGGRNLCRPVLQG